MAEEIFECLVTDFKMIEGTHTCILTLIDANSNSNSNDNGNGNGNGSEKSKIELYLHQRFYFLITENLIQKGRQLTRMNGLKPIERINRNSTPRLLPFANLIFEYDQEFHSKLFVHTIKDIDIETFNEYSDYCLLLKVCFFSLIFFF
mgnify:CR=1 FL=1